MVVAGERWTVRRKIGREGLSVQDFLRKRRKINERGGGEQIVEEGCGGGGRMCDLGGGEDERVENILDESFISF